MKHRDKNARRRNRNGLRSTYHPRLEGLEDRLPPGDVLLSGLVGLSLAGVGLSLNPLGPQGAAADLSGNVSPTPAEMLISATASQNWGGFATQDGSPQSSLSAAIPTGSSLAEVGAGQTGGLAWDGGTALEGLAGTQVAGSEGRLSSNLPPAAIPTGIGSDPELGSAAASPTRFGRDATGVAIPPAAVGQPGPVPVPLASPASAGAPTNAVAQDNYGRLPLSFEANQGQTDTSVQFLARSGGYTLFLTANEAVLELPGAATPAQAGTRTGRAQRAAGTDHSASPGGVVRMEVVGADPSARAAGLGELPGKVNYLLGNDPAQWHTNVPTYARVEYPNVYPGITLDYYGNQQQLEYDFTVAPGADPGRLALAFSGARQVQVDAQGDLVLDTAAGPVLQHRPVLYQEVNGVRQEVPGAFVLHGQQVGFQVGAYDRSQPLVVDPTWSYSTYLGGSGVDDGNGIAVDATGAAYVTGDTTSVNFPTQNAYQPGYGGAQDAFVTKLSPNGSSLVYSTYLGGSAADIGNSIAVDASGNAYVTGDTASTDFPTTLGAFQQGLAGTDNVFVTKLNPSGSGLVYSTYIGGEGDDAGAAIAVDTAGNAYVTGDTNSLSYPLTPGAYQTTLKGFDSAFVTKLNAGGSALLYSTYLGGSADAQGFGGSDYGTSIALDLSGNAYVTGGTQSLDFPTTPGAFQTSLNLNSFGDPTYDGFVSKINPTASGSASLVYSTYLGGNGDDYAMGIAVDSSGSAYVTGATDSTNYPTANAYQGANAGGDEDAFVTKLNTTGSALVSSTYLGGRLDDSSCAIAVDGLGEAYVAGTTDSLNFPTASAIQGSNAGLYDAFVTKFNASGSALIFSTYLGGLRDDGATGIALDPAGNAYVTGNTLSANFPTTFGAFQTRSGGGTDAFVTKVPNPGAADHIVITVPATVTAGVPFQASLTVQDAYNNTATGYTGTVHVSDNFNEMANYTFTAADQGMHTFTVLLTRAGSRTATATDTMNPSITGTANFVVVPGPVDHLAVSAPSSSPSGQPFDVTVTAQDAYNNTTSSYTGMVTFTSSDPGATLPADYTFTAGDGGVHTFPNGVTLVTTGDQTVTATDTVTSAVMGSATVTVF